VLLSLASVQSALGLTVSCRKGFIPTTARASSVVADDERKGAALRPPTKLCLEIAAAQVISNRRRGSSLRSRSASARPMADARSPFRPRRRRAFQALVNCPACISRAMNTLHTIAKPMAGVGSPPSCAISPS